MNATIQVHPGERLVAERMHRRWTQLEVADRLGTTPGNVSRWERGITSPGPYFRSKLCELFGKSAQELGLAWEEYDDTRNSDTLASTPMDFIEGKALHGSTPFFTDSEDLLAQLQALLRPERTASLPSVSANSRQSGSKPQQQSLDQERFMQAVAQWLQTHILENAGALVLVVLNSNVHSRTSSPYQRPSGRHTTSESDYYVEHPTIQETLRERQGARQGCNETSNF